MLRRHTPSYLALLALAGCGAGEELGQPRTGTVQIITTLTGVSPTTEPYVVVVGDEERGIGAADTVEYADLPTAEYTVELRNVPGTCSVGGLNPRTLTISGDATVQVTFPVTCAAPPETGTLEVTVVTVGKGSDPDGYLLLVDTSGGIPITGDTTVAIGGLPAGAHALRLSGAAPDCEVRGENPRSVQVLPAGAATEFTVTCVPPVSGQIAFDSDRVNRDAVFDIFLLNTDGRGLVNLTRTEGVDERDPLWSPDGAQIAFVHFEADAIHVMDADGSNIRPLVTGLSFVHGVRWSPDGSRLLFVQFNDQFEEELTTYAIATGTLQVLATASNRFAGHDWSPDGTRVAYGREDFDGESFSSAVHVVPATGGVPVELAAGPGSIFTVSDWSPDGTKVTYVGGDIDEDAADIFLASQDGSAPPQNLTNRPAAYQSPTWSPDGDRLVFLRSPGPDELGNREYDLFGITLDGHVEQLTHETRTPGTVTWSPDGSRILFELNFDIFIMNFDGTGLRILAGPGHPTDGLDNLNSAPSWRP